MSYDASPRPDTSLKVPHLVFGLLFLGLTGIWALGHSGLIEGEHLVMLAPAVLVLAGVVGLAASLASARNRHRRESETPYDTDTDHLEES